MIIYLDYNSTAPVKDAVINSMVDVYRNSPGNPDSRTHEFGKNAGIICENGRNKVAKLIGVKSNEVFFTSGATESNNIAIQGLYDYSKISGKNHIITTSIEHKSVLNTVEHMQNLGFDVDFVSPDRSGRVSVKDVLSKIKNNTLLVTMMHVNNETGIIQPVKEIGDYLIDKEIYFHIDATQSCGKLVQQLRQLNYDMMSLSAHKFGGPQGIGALILKRKNYKLPPIKNILYGGQQEAGIRPGTTPVALVAGFGVACEIAQKNYHEEEVCDKKIKQIIISELKKVILNSL